MTRRAAQTSCYLPQTSLKTWKLEGQTPRKDHFAKGLRFSPPSALMAPLPAAWRHRLADDGFDRFLPICLNTLRHIYPHQGTPILYHIFGRLRVVQEVSAGAYAFCCIYVVCASVLDPSGIAVSSARMPRLCRRPLFRTATSDERTARSSSVAPPSAYRQHHKRQKRRGLQAVQGMRTPFIIHNS